MVNDLEEYVTREDEHGLPDDLRDIFIRLTQLEGLNYPPVDASQATELFKKLSAHAP